MKNKKQQIISALFIMGTVLLFIFVSFKPWIYVTEGKEYQTSSEFEFNRGKKISIDTTVFTTGYEVLDKKGQVKYTVYAVIIGDKLVFLPDNGLLEDEKFTQQRVTGIISAVSQNHDLKRLKQTIGEKYVNPTAVGVDIPAQISSYYIEPDYSKTTFFVFFLLALGTLFLVSAFILNAMYRKSDEYINQKTIFSNSQNEMDDIKRSLLDETIYYDEYIQISKKYFSCGNENIEMSKIKEYSLTENELIIILTDGKKTVIPATEPWQYNSIQRAYQGLEIYLPEN